YFINPRHNGGTAGGHGKRRNVLPGGAKAADDSHCPDFDELVNGAGAANKGVIADFHVSAQLDGIGQNYLIAYNTVVGDMGVSHQHTPIADDGFLILATGPVHGNAFPNDAAIADTHPSGFSRKLQIL